jgi:hypothetical protein
MLDEIDLSTMDCHLEGGYIKGQVAFYIFMKNGP